MTVWRVLGEVLCEVLAVLAAAGTALALVPVTVALAAGDLHLLALAVLGVVAAALSLGGLLGLLSLCRPGGTQAVRHRAAQGRSGWAWGTYTDAPGLRRWRVRTTRRCGGLLSVQLVLAGHGMTLHRRHA